MSWCGLNWATPLLTLDDTVTVEVVAGLEREERGHPNHQRSEDFIKSVEVLVREAGRAEAPGSGNWNPSGVSRDADAKSDDTTLPVLAKGKTARAGPVPAYWRARAQRPRRGARFARSTVPALRNSRPPGRLRSTG